MMLCLIAGPLVLAGGQEEVKEDEYRVKQTSSGSFSAADYNTAFANAILFFEGQRSGKLPSNQRVKWRSDSALSDGKSDNVTRKSPQFKTFQNFKFG